MLLQYELFATGKKPLDKEQLQDGIDAAINEINNMKQVISVNTKGVCL